MAIPSTPSNDHDDDPATCVVEAPTTSDNDDPTTTCIVDATSMTQVVVAWR